MIDIPEGPDPKSAHLDHLYASGTFPAPENAHATDVWGCPRFHADWARDLILEMDDAHRDMDEEDGDEESVYSGKW